MCLGNVEEYSIRSSTTPIPFANHARPLHIPGAHYRVGYSKQRRKYREMTTHALHASVDSRGCTFFLSAFSSPCLSQGLSLPAAPPASSKTPQEFPVGLPVSTRACTIKPKNEAQEWSREANKTKRNLSCLWTGRDHFSKRRGVTEIIANNGTTATCGRKRVISSRKCGTFCREMGCSSEPSVGKEYVLETTSLSSRSCDHLRQGLSIDFRVRGSMKMHSDARSV